MSNNSCPTSPTSITQEIGSAKNTSDLNRNNNSDMTDSNAQPSSPTVQNNTQKGLSRVPRAAKQASFRRQRPKAHSSTGNLAKMSKMVHIWQGHCVKVKNRERRALRRAKQRLGYRNVRFCTGHQLLHVLEFDPMDSVKTLVDPEHIPEEYLDEIPWFEEEYEELAWWEYPDLDEDDPLTAQCRQQLLDAGSISGATPQDPYDLKHYSDTSPIHKLQQKYLEEQRYVERIEALVLQFVIRVSNRSLFSMQMYGADAAAAAAAAAKKHLQARRQSTQSNKRASGISNSSGAQLPSQTGWHDHKLDDTGSERRRYRKKKLQKRQRRTEDGDDVDDEASVYTTVTEYTYTPPSVTPPSPPPPPPPPKENDDKEASNRSPSRTPTRNNKKTFSKELEEEHEDWHRSAPLLSSTTEDAADAGKFNESFQSAQSEGDKLSASGKKKKKKKKLKGRGQLAMFLEGETSKPASTSTAAAPKRTKPMVNEEEKSVDLDDAIARDDAPVEKSHRRWGISRHNSAAKMNLQHLLPLANPAMGGSGLNPRKASSGNKGDDDDDDNMSKQTPRMRVIRHASTSDLMINRQMLKNPAMDGHNGDNDSKGSIDEEEQLKVRIVMLRHAAVCAHRGGSCPCDPTCSEMKELLKHITTCKNVSGTNRCSFPGCLESKMFLLQMHRISAITAQERSKQEENMPKEVAIPNEEQDFDDDISDLHTIGTYATQATLEQKKKDPHQQTVEAVVEGEEEDDDDDDDQTAPHTHKEPIETNKPVSRRDSLGQSDHIIKYDSLGTGPKRMKSCKGQIENLRQMYESQTQQPNPQQPGGEDTRKSTMKRRSSWKGSVELTRHADAIGRLRVAESEERFSRLREETEKIKSQMKHIEEDSSSASKRVSLIRRAQEAREREEEALFTKWDAVKKKVDKKEVRLVSSQSERDVKERVRLQQLEREKERQLATGEADQEDFELRGALRARHEQIARAKAEKEAKERAERERNGRSKTREEIEKEAIGRLEMSYRKKAEAELAMQSMSEKESREKKEQWIAEEKERASEERARLEALRQKSAAMDARKNVTTAKAQSERGISSLTWQENVRKSELVDAEETATEQDHIGRARERKAVVQQQKLDKERESQRRLEDAKAKYERLKRQKDEMEEKLNQKQNKLTGSTQLTASTQTARTDRIKELTTKESPSIALVKAKPVYSNITVTALGEKEKKLAEKINESEKRVAQQEKKSKEQKEMQIKDYCPSAEKRLLTEKAEAEKAEREMVALLKEKKKLKKLRRKSLK